MMFLKKPAILLILFLSVILVSCGNNNNNYKETATLSAKEIAGQVLDNVEFPKMKELQDKEDLIKYIEIDFEYVEDVCFYWQMISVELAEVLIIKPKTGYEKEALAFADSRREKISKDTAFYPSQEAAADASVSGIINGIVYFICGNEAGVAEESLIQLIELFSD